MSQADAPCYVFGIGAQKAGSSWLFDVLAGHPDVHCPKYDPLDPVTVLKELHYFDVLHVPEMAHRHTFNQAAIEELAQDLGQSTGARRNRLIRVLQGRLEQLRTYAGPMGNDALFRSFAERGRKGQRLVLDITPDYSLLPAEGFAHMRRFAPNSKYILLLREPVARLWSAVRYNTAQPKITLAMTMINGGFLPERDPGTDPEAFQAACLADLRKRITRMNPDGQNRLNYVWTLKALSQVIPRDDICVVFYEELFTEQGLGRILDFLDLPDEGAAFEKRVNSSPSLSLPEADQRAAAAFFAPQYRFIEAWMGRPLPEAWTRMEALA